MKARYENDPVRGPGYGLLYMEDIDAANTDVRFAVVRSGDHKTLHPESWEDTECRLIPDGVSARDNGLCLAVGPGVVRQLDELNTYRLVLFSSPPDSPGPAAAPQHALLELAGIIYPPEDDTARVGPAPEPKAAPAAPPPPEPRPEPDPEPGPAPETLPPLARTRSKTPFPVWLIALLLILAGGAAWFALRDKPADPPGTEAAAEATGETPGEPAAAGPETAESANGNPPSDPPAPLPPMEQARQFLRGNGSAADGLALSRALPRTPEGRDAAYLLLAAAADQGQAEAMLDLAALYDPLDAEPKGSILPDAEQAWLWYDKAEKAGQADAAGRKQALRARLEEDAAKGSAEAKDVLSRIR